PPQPLSRGRGLVHTTRAMGPGTLLLCILLMLVGGGGGSTAGGIKIGTVWVLLLALRAGLTGQEKATVGRRAITSRQVLSALALLFSVVLLFLAGTAALSLADGVSLQAAAFEVMSALGTVGLSTGITPGLSVFSKIVLICLMFLGRVGILSFSMAFLIRGRQPRRMEYPPANIMVG
ncbi:MAG: potassium uptake protein, TrkH family, partial [Oscillospiraceae bacterium]|nr:potassium uptake protein, TrkH family [Oscillospiraceae bacterium]